jgi:hypothetical protein
MYTPEAVIISTITPMLTPTAMSKLNWESVTHIYILYSRLSSGETDLPMAISHPNWDLFCSHVPLYALPDVSSGQRQLYPPIVLTQVPGTEHGYLEFWHSLISAEANQNIRETPLEWKNRREEGATYLGSR